MRIVVAGATGFVGTALCARLAADGHRVVALVRRAGGSSESLPEVVKRCRWEPRQTGEWCAEVRSADAVVNLAGESVARRRWTPAFKAILHASRIETTRSIVEAMRDGEGRERALVNASASGYYGDTGDREVDETAPAGSGFLAELCRDWEAEASRAEDVGIRAVLLRLGVVLGPGGGALSIMAAPHRWFVGGRLGSGQQWVPWIHLDDVCGLVVEALASTKLSGPVNAVAPGQVRMRELAGTLGRALRRPAWLPVPGFALRLVLGEFAETLLTGQRIKPAVAERLSYRWRHGDLESALNSCLAGNRQD